MIFQESILPLVNTEIPLSPHQVFVYYVNPLNKHSPAHPYIQPDFPSHRVTGKMIRHHGFFAPQMVVFKFAKQN